MESPKEEPVKNNIGTILYSGLIGILIGMAIMDVIQRTNVNTKANQKVDTTYNKVKLDSIKLQVGKHDTTIYNLNIKLKDDIQKSYRLDDSATVVMFRELSKGTN